MTREYAIGLATGIVIAGVACGSSSAVPTTSDPIPWREATVYADDAVRAVTVLESAYGRLPQDWTPRNWRIVFKPGLIPCHGTINGVAAGCRGVTSTQRVIELSWAAGVTLEAVATWELANARCYDVGGRFRDEGWTCPV